ncbi:MAG: hypothetical protein E7J94_24095 [Clostridium sp.]|uniref:hypothetical protein n=1 Tax=Clostridia TaxID=186801 RepID=UPI00067F1DCD|nr:MULTISPECIES: hypothetical protein [Clostridia]MDU7710338.1 hypothetical protein [Clostridium sp.]
MRTTVKIISGEDLPFLIRTAKWELIDESEIIEDSGECIIDEHELDAYISPQKIESYTLRFIYEVADEIWVDKIRVVVS